MESPIFQKNELVISAGDMTSDITSSYIDISEYSCYSVHASWTGTPAGNIIVQASNDTNLTPVNVATQAAGGSAGSYLFNSGVFGYKFVRIFYDATSSTGVLNVRLSGKK